MPYRYKGGQPPGESFPGMLFTDPRPGARANWTYPFEVGPPPKPKETDSSSVTDKSEGAPSLEDDLDDHVVLTDP